VDHETDLADPVDGFRLYCLAEGKRRAAVRWCLGKLRICPDHLRADDSLPILRSDRSAGLAANGCRDICVTHLRTYPEIHNQRA